MIKLYSHFGFSKSVEARLEQQLEKAQHDRLDLMQSVEDYALALKGQRDALETSNDRILRLRKELRSAKGVSNA